MKKLLTLTGPSCSGKTTLLNALVEKHGFQSIVSHTTRPRRPGEEFGKDYYFVSQEYFDKKKDKNEFIESISFNGYSYGVSLDEIQAAQDSGKIAVLIVEPTGLIQMQIYVEKNVGVEIKSVYIDGLPQDLIARYLKRLAGEDLSSEGTAERHARRIHSLVNEVPAWKPKSVDHGHSPEGEANMIDYDIILYNLTSENFEETITKIKEMEFKND